MSTPSPTTDADRTRALVDRAAIHRSLRRYAQGVDQRQWDVFRSAFAPGATVAVPGWIEGSVSVDRFVELLSGAFDDIRLSGQHHLANTRIVFAAADPAAEAADPAAAPATLTPRPLAARVVTEFLAVNAERASADADDRRVRTQVSGGLQVDDFERHGDDWLIRHRVLVRKNDDLTEAELTPDRIALLAGAARNPVSAGL
ncbi:nuclear transport factor 2 family protein [Leucobacter rhizosphaerae]|uniref:Nuclear transport factor 2 family protein n=1 Tax=Leucobacter rhizosphaerae TaxID=2932245 RepID=A0ABY4FTU0_9MICO|nr:nuclear transport factor 2 family protein [Leucobacter rhizosphaerae]UOQ59721.1 nuclear transport factor 2 family protein [Leucobacter rhizosphaerae]